MIICSCACISDFDIELALLDLLNQPEAPIPHSGSRLSPPRKAHELLRLRAGGGGE